MKKLLKKAKDPYLALLAYRATPIANGYSPAELLMGRRLRIPVPQHPSLLDPELPDGTVVAEKEREKRGKDITSFNNRHCVRDLSQLTPGQPVWITDAKSQGTVVSSHSAHVHTSWTALQAPSGVIDTILSLLQRLFHTHLTHRHPALHHNQVSLQWVLQNAPCRVQHRLPRYTQPSVTHLSIHTHRVIPLGVAEW